MKGFIESSRVTLNYKCSCCDATAQERLIDLVDLGTIICEDCDQEMDIDSFITIENPDVATTK